MKADLDLVDDAAVELEAMRRRNVLRKAAAADETGETLVPLPAAESLIVGEILERLVVSRADMETTAVTEVFDEL